MQVRTLVYGITFTSYLSKQLRSLSGQAGSDPDLLGDLDCAFQPYVAGPSSWLLDFEDASFLSWKVELIPYLPYEETSGKTNAPGSGPFPSPSIDNVGWL